MLKLGLLFGLAISANSILASAPKRFMILVFDQTRAEYADRFDLKNFKRAKAMGLDFKNGIVGHLESNTVISHPVITSGKMPKNLPWPTHVMKDTSGLLGKKNEFYTPFALTTDQWMSVLKKKGVDSSSILARIKSKNPGKTYAVAQKKYAAFTYGGPAADTIICLGSVTWEGPYKGHYQPYGVRVPKYITEAKNGRFYIDSTNDWGSGQMVYPFHGNVFIEGKNPERLGGDKWVGDVVEKIMENDPKWSAIVASFGSIDKVSHVLHEHDGPTNYDWAKKHQISLKDTAQKADKELGRILDRLEREELLKETAILITADHGGQYSRNFHGTRKPNQHQKNLFYGKSKSFNNLKDYPKGLKEVFESGAVDIASMNTMLSFWTKGAASSGQLKAFMKALKTAPGVARIYRKEVRGGMTWYKEQYTSTDWPKKARRWADTRLPSLLHTLAGESGPDYVAFLKDGHGYDVPGSHGGAQELVQRIPYILVAPNLKKVGQSATDFVRLVDVNAILGKVLNLRNHPGIDGRFDAVTSRLK